MVQMAGCVCHSHPFRGCTSGIHKGYADVLLIPGMQRHDFRVSQLLKIETSGFDRNAYLKYDLYGTS